MILKNFWVIEGLDGSGTTTQLGKIKDELEKRKVPCFITCEPSPYETGQFLRKILSGEIKCPQSTIARMFSTDRDNHLFNSEYGIIKQLEMGKTVVSDRYFFSSFAYQSIGFSYKQVETLNEDFPYPEKVIFVDTPVEDCITRINARGMEKEIYEKYEYQKLVHANYNKCFENLPVGCTLIRVDGSLTREEIFSQIKEKLF